MGLWIQMGVPGRRTDTDMVYVVDQPVSGHGGGQIWSSALMKIWGDLGRDITDQLFLETHLLWGFSPNLRSAAIAFMQADINLYNGVHLCDIRARFNQHGLVSSVPQAIYYNTTWNKDVHVVDSITIQSGATLTITSTVKFNEQSSITIQPGAKLVIDGGKLTAACPDQLWQGIVVLGNRFQSQSPQYQGMVELKNGARIEHALCAISAAPASYSSFGRSSGGGIIQADSAIFYNNLQAIEYSPYEYQISPGNIADNVGKFTNCTFTIDDGSRFSANGNIFKNHVTLWAVRGIIFEGCRFDDMADIPYPPSRLPTYPKRGIYALDAGFKIINHCKRGGSTSGDCPCRPTHTKPTFFFNLDGGVYSENTGVSRSIYMDQSRFQRLSTGVSMNVQNNYRLTRCDFINVSTGLYLYFTERNGARFAGKFRHRSV